MPSSSVHKKNGARPASPVMISRSSQTEFTSGVSESSLKEKPHPLYDASKAGVNDDISHRGKIGQVVYLVNRDQTGLCFFLFVEML